MIEVGDRIPGSEVRVMRDGTPVTVSMHELAGSGRVVLFAVPGAFTPGCSQRHLPGFVAQAAEMSAKGVDRILCLSVNDAYVMDAWGQAQAVGDTMVMVADPAAAFTRDIGMDIDVSGLGLGLRSQRYAMVIEDGVVVAFMPEEGGLTIAASTSQCVLAAL